MVAVRDINEFGTGGLTPDLTVALASSNDEFDVQQPTVGIDKDIQLNAALGLLAAK